MKEETELEELRRWNTAHCNDWVRLQQTFRIEFDAPEAMIEAIRIKFSRLSALLDEAEAALAMVPSIEFADIGHVETQRFINAAASVSAKIAKEKSE